MRSNNSNTDIPPEERPLFCTACGEELEDFCFSQQAKDIEALKQRLAQCKETGKFTGGTCALLFIARQEE